MPNRYDRPATARTAANRRATMDNPLAGMQDTGSISRNAAEELAVVLRTMREADAGQHRGPLPINSPHWACICCESQDQRDAFRAALQLSNHGVQYWDAAAFVGTVGLLKDGLLVQRSFGKRDNPFAKRDNPFAREDAAAAARAAKAAENAEKFSELRAEAKRTADKLRRYTQDGTWIAICAQDGAGLADVFRALGIPAAKWLHIDDVLDALSTMGCPVDVPRVEFGLRATARPDKALNALVLR